MHLNNELIDFSFADDLTLLLQEAFDLSLLQSKGILQTYRLYPDEYRLVGLRDQTGILALAGLKLKNKTAFFYHLAVRRSERNKGIGRKLLSLIKRSFNLFRLDAVVGLSAYRFFERCGFTCLNLGDINSGCVQYFCSWLDSYQVLNPDFRFPQPAIEQVHLPGTEQHVDLLRLDQIHPLLSGNKWFKLRWNLIQARQNEQRRVLTFGGAWSNHIFATAAAGSLLGFETIAIIRGEEPEQPSPILQFAKSCGMQFKFVSRAAYRNKHQADFLKELQKTYTDALIIPEGGANAAGVVGTQEIMGYVPEQYTLIATACGTASTLSGLISAESGQRFLGVSALKGGSFLYDEVNKHTDKRLQDLWEIDLRYHCRGFAKKTPELESFIEAFSICNTVPIEHTYTAKLFYALSQRYQAQEILPQEKVLALQTGGIYPWNDSNYLLQESLFPVLE